MTAPVVGMRVSTVAPRPHPAPKGKGRPVGTPLTLLEGVVDLAFRDGDSWTVIDFKTDREISQAGLDRYRRQVALYAAAIGRATGAGVSAYLLRV